MKDERTLRDLNTLYTLVVHGSSALLDELVSLNTNVEHFRVWNTKPNELFECCIDNICSGLKPVSYGYGK